MNVVFLTRLFYPHIGGVEKHVYGISQILKKHHKIAIITEQHDPKLPEHEVIDGLEIYRIPTKNASTSSKKWFIWKWLKSHEQLLNNADVIHAHDVYFWIIPFKIIYPFKNTFVTYHGWEGKFPIPLKNRIIRKITEVMANANICVGTFISTWYGTKPTAITYGAV